MIYDIIIVGGGMVGASFAYALRDTPHRIALIDNTALNPLDDHRLIALNTSSQAFLKQCELWEKLESFATPIHEIHVSERGSFGMTRLQQQNLGYVVPAKNINAILYEHLAQTKIDILRPANLTQLTEFDDQVEIKISTPQGEKTLTSKILIGADGSHSTVRKLLNIPTKSIDYQQSALVTITTLQRHHRYVAYERFHTTGAIAMLPLEDNQCATIWSDKTAIISELKQLSDAAFLQRLQQQFGYRLGRLCATQKRHVFPLHFIQAELMGKQHTLLIGNAAHTIHPLAAQGLNLAFQEVAQLVQIILQQSLDIKQLQKVFLPRQHFSLQLSHRLNRLFSTDFFLLNCARQLGLLSFDILPFIKQRFIKQLI